MIDETKVREARDKMVEATELLNSILNAPASKKRILICPGHSSKRQGYKGRNGRFSEHDCTVMISSMATVGLRNLGYHVDIYDPAVDDLKLDGAKAKGYDAYIAPHLNAYDADDEDEYTCVLVHPNRRQASIMLANSIAVKTLEALSEEVSAKMFSPNAKYPGVYFRAVTVLSHAERVTPPAVPCVLPESFFLDAYSDASLVETLCEKAAIGIINGVSEYFYNLT